MKKTVLISLISCFLLGLLFACSDKNEGGANHDPNKEMEIISFQPDSGGARTQMVIEGVNFGTDRSLISVTFGDQKLPASVLNTNGTSIYCLVPPGQPDGMNKIEVKVGNQEKSFGDAQFRYVVREQVSLVAGQPDKSGDEDGSLSTALFRRLFAVFSVDGGSLLAFGDGNPRLISPSDNSVVTLQNGVRVMNGCMTKDRKTVYGVTLGYPHALYKYTKEGLWRPELVTPLIDIDKDLFACTLDDTEEWLYFYVTLNAEVRRLNLKDPTIVEKVCNVGSSVGYWGGITYSDVEDCFYVAGFDLSGIYRISKDGKTVENYAGFHGFQYKDGLAKDAGIPSPAGIITDEKGDIYFSDVRAGTVRKIDYRTKIVSTVAGQPHVRGDKNGLPKESTFRDTYGLSRDDDGNMYITSSDNFGTVRKLAIE